MPNDVQIVNIFKRKEREKENGKERVRKKERERAENKNLFIKVWADMFKAWVAQLVFNKSKDTVVIKQCGNRWKIQGVG